MSILNKLGATPAKDREVLTLTSPAAVAAAATWVQAKHASQAADAALEIAAGNVTPLARAEWFRGNAGRQKPCTSVLIPTTNGTALVSFAAVWSAKGGAERLPDDLRRERFTIRISGDDLPDAVAGAFVDGLLALAKRLGVEAAVSATGGIAPVPTFNDVRHVRLTPAENEALEAAGLGTRVTLRVK